MSKQRFAQYAIVRHCLRKKQKKSYLLQNSQRNFMYAIARCVTGLGTEVVIVKHLRQQLKVGIGKIFKVVGGS